MRNERESRGLIFSIGRASGENGPGIRTTLFLKGCPLKCLWCHSPQSQGSSQPRLVFYQNRCILCGLCSKACPQGAQLQDDSMQEATATEAVAPGHSFRRILWDRCNQCGRCVEVCPSRALELAGEWMTVDRVLDVVRKDAVYYESSGGGVTFSGGEPTAQPDFLEACARRCRSGGFHTALDTCGYVGWEVLAKILPHIELFLFDLKHMDSERHRQLTGVSNELIHENLRRIDSQGKAIWIRIPLIPGYNDSDENLREMAEMVRPLQSVRRVSILPYNSAAGAHYEMIGQLFQLDEIDSLDGREQRALQIFASANIKAELGA